MIPTDGFVDLIMWAGFAIVGAVFWLILDYLERTADNDDDSPDAES